MSIKINNVDFNVIRNKGRGDCFLFAILEFFSRTNFNPFVANDEKSFTSSVENNYREFLFNRLLNVNNMPEYNNPDNPELGLYGNITKVNDVLWKNLRSKLRKDISARGKNVCLPGTYIGELMFQLIVVLYKDIKNIYVYKPEYTTWWHYYIEKEPNKNYAVVKGKKIKKNFQVTRDSNMFILFTQEHYELMIPVQDNVEIMVTPKTSNFLANIDLLNDDTSEIMSNDQILTKIVRDQTINDEQCFQRANYTGQQDDAMEAFNNLAEINNGSDILKSFYARQFKSFVCRKPNIRRDKTPHDERFTISFLEKDSIQSLQQLVKKQITALTGDNQWEYNGRDKCDATEITKYQFYDYVMIQLKIFNDDESKRKLSEEHQKKLINNTLQLPTVDDGVKPFQLIGSINHRGNSIKGGHYIAVVKKQTAPYFNERWWVCDDNKVYDVANSFPYFKDHEPYILFYKRSSIPLDKRKPLGIDNEGNSCYINALMQNIINVPELFIRKKLRGVATGGAAPKAGSSTEAELDKQLDDIRREKAAAYAKRFYDKLKEAEKKKRELNDRLKELEKFKQILVEEDAQTQINEQLINVRRELATLDGQASDTDSEMDIDNDNDNNNNYDNLLGFLADDNNINDNDNNNNDNESKGETPSPKRMRMDPDYDPYYEDACQRLLNVAKREYERLKDKNKLEGRKLKDFIKSKGNRCGFDEKYIKGAIEKSQKRSLISLSRITL